MENVIGIAAGGILRLILATRTYGACKGGATLLATYPAFNETGVHGTTYHAADYVGIWQVCISKIKKINRDMKVFFFKGIAIEFIVTFVLVTVILMVALDTKSKTGLAPILIGFTLAVNILAM